MARHIQRTEDRGQRTVGFPARSAAVNPTKAKPSLAEQSSVLGHQSSDLDVLFPERALEIGGEKITVRELTFGEQLKHNPALAAIASALQPALDAPDADALTVILDALAGEHEAVIDLISVSTGKPKDWITAQSGDVGETLLLAWWGAHQGFFTRRLLRPFMAKLAANANNGGASLPPSSGTGTGNAS